MYQDAADIRDVYLYKMLSVQVGSLGERCAIDKNKGRMSLNTWNTL